MSKNDWTDKLRDQLADHQEPVSHDLWAGIESSLAHKNAAENATTEVLGKNARLVSIRRWSAAAAAVALLGIGGSYVYLHQDPGQGTGRGATLVAAKKGATLLTAHCKSAERLTASSETAAHKGSADLQSAASSKANYDGVWVAAEKDTSLLAADCKSAEPLTVSSKSAEHLADTSQEGSTAAFVPSGNANGNTNSNIAGNTAAMARLEEAFAKKSHSTMDLALNLYAENFISADGSGMSEGIYAYADPMPGHDYMSQVPSWSEMATNLLAVKAASYKESKHHAPLSIGIQMAFGIAPRTSLSTGVVYTRTSSDFKVSNISGYNIHQVLHYVGVPLNVNYEVLRLGNFKTYVMAGGEADFNVKNNTEDQGQKVDDVKKDRPQFSAKASVGLQYDLVPQVGLYMEPGARYYFDNGSDIENTFKDKKWNFNFQLGLRVNLGK